VCQHSAKSLDGVKLAGLARKFADSIPDEEFSVAALQGCKLVKFLQFVVGLLFPPFTAGRKVGENITDTFCTSLLIRSAQEQVPARVRR
jgi:hypothetical protein